jgi:two-component system, NtrC family, response regulator AtoC
MPNATVLVVDDEPLIRWSLVNRLKEEGYRTLEAGTAGDAVAQHRDGGADLILLDYALPDANGLDVLKQVKDTDPDTLVIMLTANTDVGTAVAAMKQGAFHYANKPFDLDEITVLVEKALETTQLRREVRTLRARQAQPYGPESIVGDSEAIKTVRALLHKISVSPASTVLLTGESGTGKDLAAKVIHYSSARSAKPFMNITCSALPETLLESELFGHERGAFTGADRQKRGLIETADGGTVFLDEIGEIVPLLQSKLLRFLEEKAFKRVGGSSDIKVDVRVIAATNRSLEDEVKKGRFREDLYYRLNVMAVPLPPLRDRRDDIPLMVEHFLAKLATAAGRPAPKPLDPAALARLVAHRWPGNVRELENEITRADALSGDRIGVGDLSPAVAAAGDPGAVVPDDPDSLLLKPRVERLERSLLREALGRAANNQTKAAEILGLSRFGLQKKLKRYNFSV